MRIDQVLPAFVARDAIGNHTRNLKDALNARGIDSTIYYKSAAPDVISLGENISEMPDESDDRFLLYHCSIGTPIVNRLLHMKTPLIVDYHNITPAKYFEKWLPATGGEAALGRRQLGELASKAVLGLADSPYNERELIDVGYSPTAVAPLLINLEKNPEVNHELLRSLLERKEKTGAPQFLFVGTLSSHKAPHEIIAMLAAYREIYHPEATLTLVGRPFGGRYLGALHGYVKALGLIDAVNLAGSLPGQDLEAYWQSADVFTVASNHEGFCVPIIEAMNHSLPIVAYGAAAIPETVADAGLVISDKSPVPFAAAVHRVVEDQALRDHFNRAANIQLETYDLEKASKVFIDVLLDGINITAHDILVTR